MSVDETRLNTFATGAVGSSLTFRATLGSEKFSHVGFGTDFAAPPWAMFSTGPAAAGTSTPECQTLWVLAPTTTT